MGRFQIKVGIKGPENDRFEQFNAWVDNRPGHMIVPTVVLERLGYTPARRRYFVLEDGGEALLRTCKIAVRISGQTRLVSCLFDEECGEVRLGSNTLQTFNLEVNPADETLMPMMLRLPSFRLEDDEGKYVHSNN